MRLFTKDADEYYRAGPLRRLAWLEHGFGARNALYPVGELATVKQIHSALVIHGQGFGGVLGEGDAIVEDRPGVAIAVKTADCLPILIVDPVHRAAGMVHAGWRGTVARIGELAVEAMGARYESVPEHLEVAIGPGIGPCCFEVGPEVACQFGSLGGRVKLDLAKINANQLVDAGIRASNIYLAGLCTACEPDFWSYRRDGQSAGRMLSFARISTAGAV